MKAKMRRVSDAGKVTERPKVHDWKSCVRLRTEGSNPSLSAMQSMNDECKLSSK